MNLPSSINKGLFQQVVVLLIPGALLVVPFVIILFASSNFRGITKDFLCGGRIDFEMVYFLCGERMDFGMVYFLSFVFCFIFGLIFENIGSIFDDFFTGKFSDEDKEASNFFLYSRCGDGDVQVIHKHIESISFRYNMELSLIPAWIFFLFEWICIYRITIINCDFFYIVTIIALLSLIFTFQQAKKSCGYLREVREAYYLKHKKWYD